MLPLFKRSEAHIDRADQFHGRTGELTVRRATGNNAMFDAYVEAGQQAGHPFTDDFNGERQEGFGRYDFTIRQGKRCSAATAFLVPAKARPNLIVATQALVHRVVLEGASGRWRGVSGRRPPNHRHGGQGGAARRRPWSTPRNCSCCRA